jgi:hypothetical protein
MPLDSNCHGVARSLLSGYPSLPLPPVSTSSSQLTQAHALPSPAAQHTQPCTPRPRPRPVHVAPAQCRVIGHPGDLQRLARLARAHLVGRPGGAGHYRGHGQAAAGGLVVAT